MRTWILLLITATVPVIGWSMEGEVSHSDPVIPILLALTIVTLVALMGREIAQRFDQPSVLGELIIGILIGNIGYWLGNDWISVLREFSAVFNALTLTF